jgi:(1->4)-alpha-D-glucan 1-alpha-D-glucosylmutase
VQISPGFDLYAAAGLAGYLAALGVTHLYTSPLLASAPGSAHGYDVVDHSMADPQRGGEAGRVALLAALREHGLGMVLDLVPNHTGVDLPQTNPAWWDFLRLGPESAFADWFDVDWSFGRVLIPLLPDDSALSDVELDGGVLSYGPRRFPVAPGTADLGSARAVHDAQHYELVTGARDQLDHNYRRFFAVSTLAGLRVEDRGVFDATHAEVLRWVAEGGVDGLRIDHPDGLADPEQYLARLRAAAVPAGSDEPCWLIIEKVLEPGERLPTDWSIEGTTGYDAMPEVDAVLVDPAGEAGFTALDAELTGVQTSWPELVHDCKLEVASSLLLAELRRLARGVGQLSTVDGAAGAAGSAAEPDPGVVAALAEIAACFPVYRSYLPDGIEHLNEALAEARRRRPELVSTMDMLAPRLADSKDPLAVRFQQTTGAVMAKGVEDTAYYRWTRFIAANEVGGDPGRFGLSVADFHAAQALRQRHLPKSMTTLSTHDTKRSEDVRARLAVLSEIPGEWAATVRRWMAAAPIPDGAQAHLLWQTVAGAWPLDRDRLHGVIEKSMREARTSTSWETPSESFEASMHAAIDQVYDAPSLRADVDGFVSRITPDGWTNSLTANLLQITMPGVPDVYQGCELWDNSLVDPDNRRPVDFTARADLLARLDAGWQPTVDATGAAKLLVVSRALRARRDRAAAFVSYTPVLADGAAADHAVAFDRGDAVSVGTRLPVGLRAGGGWRDTVLPLPPGPWIDALTGVETAGRAPLADLLSRYPVALLLRP